MKCCSCNFLQNTIKTDVSKCCTCSFSKNCSCNFFSCSCSFLSGNFFLQLQLFSGNSGSGRARAWCEVIPTKHLNSRFLQNPTNILQNGPSIRAWNASGSTGIYKGCHFELFWNHFGVSSKHPGRLQGILRRREPFGAVLGPSGAALGLFRVVPEPALVTPRTTKRTPWGPAPKSWGT